MPDLSGLVVLAVLGICAIGFIIGAFLATIFAAALALLGGPNFIPLAPWLGGCLGAAAIGIPMLVKRYRRD